MANVRKEMERDVRISWDSLKTVAQFPVLKYWLLTFFLSFFHSVRKDRHKIYSGSQLKDLKGQNCKHLHCARGLTNLNSFKLVIFKFILSISDH